jgi:hypothetical protein
MRQATARSPQWCFVKPLKQLLDGYRYYQKLIAGLDREIMRLMQTLPSAVETRQEIPRRTKHSAFQRQGDEQR